MARDYDASSDMQSILGVLSAPSSQELSATTTTAAPAAPRAPRRRRSAARVRSDIAIAQAPTYTWQGAVQSYHRVVPRRNMGDRSKAGSRKSTVHTEAIRRQRVYRLNQALLGLIPCMHNAAQVFAGDADLTSWTGALTQTIVYIKRLQREVAESAPHLVPRPGENTLKDLYNTLSAHDVPEDTQEVFDNPAFLVEQS